jgi:hypothetical protein
MKWSEDLIWVDIPVGADGHDGRPGDDTLTAYVGWQGGDRLVPVAMILRSTNSERLTPAQWRRLKPGEIISASRDQLEGGALLLSMSNDTDDRAGARALLGAVPPGRATGTGDRDQHYAEVGRVYMEALKMSDTQPVQAVRTYFRKRYPERFATLKDTTVRGWVRTAKKKGYITATARPSRRKHTKG